jgi:hypothetical protein
MFRSARSRVFFVDLTHSPTVHRSQLPDTPSLGLPVKDILGRMQNTGARDLWTALVQRRAVRGERKFVSSGNEWLPFGVQFRYAIPSFQIDVALSTDVVVMLDVALHEAARIVRRKRCSRSDALAEPCLSEVAAKRDFSKLRWLSRVE